MIKYGFTPLWLGLFLFTPPVDGAAKRPNILFAFADDWGRMASAYALLDGPGTLQDVVQTPHFDRVAREGVLFRHAFVSAPSCTPCRSAILTGQHFWRTGRGAILLGAVWDESQPAYPQLLRAAGYHLGETYKVWSPGTPADAPYGAGAFAYEAAGRRFNSFSQNVTKLVADGATIADAKASLYAEVRANFDAFLADRQPQQPFCYWFGPTNVHRKWIAGSGTALWGIRPDDLQGKLPPFLPDVPEVRQDLADYLGEIQAFDAALGVLIQRLEAIGELDHTLVVVSGDHGPPGFPHGKCNLYDFGASVPLAIRWGGAIGHRVLDDLISLTDLAPTFLELGGVDRPVSMTGRSLVPLLTTDKSGQVDPQRDAVFIGRERHVDMARADFMPYPQRAIRTHDFLYVINFKPDRFPLGDPYRLDSDDPPTATELTESTFVTLPDEDAGPTKAWLVGVRNDPQWRSSFDLAYGKRPREELYDLRSDPHQIHNMADDIHYAVIRRSLEQRLMDELQRTGDPRLVDDGRFFETPPLSGPRRGALSAAAQDDVEDSPNRPVKDLILPGETFRVAGHAAFVMLPAPEKRKIPQPWILYSPTLPGLPDVHEKWMHERFLNAGVAVAGIDVGEAYGSPQGRQLFDAFYREMTEQRGYSRQPCLLGRSRGGLWNANWAIEHPDRVAGFAGIYPVFDLRSYPGLAKAAEAYELTAEQLANQLDAHNPIARIDVLARARVPALLIHGNADTVVPLADNSAAFVERYQQHGGADLVTLVVAEGQGHNMWEGFFRCQRLIDFVVERAHAGARFAVSAWDLAVVVFG